MKMIATCCLFLISRQLYFFAIQGSHSDLYYLTCNNLKDISQYLCIYLLLSQVHTISPKALILMKYAKLYCLSFAVLMFYPFLPEAFRDMYIYPILLSYNMFWLLLLTALLLYGSIPRKYTKIFDHEKI